MSYHVILIWSLILFDPCKQVTPWSWLDHRFYPSYAEKSSHDTDPITDSVRTIRTSHPTTLTWSPTLSKLRRRVIDDPDPITDSIWVMNTCHPMIPTRSLILFELHRRATPWSWPKHRFCPRYADESPHGHVRKTTAYSYPTIIIKPWSCLQSRLITLLTTLLSLSKPISLHQL